jgi:hypothetical protein
MKALVTVTKESTCAGALLPRKLCALNDNRHFHCNIFGTVPDRKRELLTLV